MSTTTHMSEGTLRGYMDITCPHDMYVLETTHVLTQAASMHSGCQYVASCSTGTNTPLSCSAHNVQLFERAWQKVLGSRGTVALGPRTSASLQAAALPARCCHVCRYLPTCCCMASLECGTLKQYHTAARSRKDRLLTACDTRDCTFQQHAQLLLLYQDDML